MSSASSHLKIRIVSEQTGIPRNTIVAWERRYGLITPTRLPNGYRVYSTADVERLKRAKALVDQGHAISEVAALLDADGHATAEDGLDPLRAALQEDKDRNVGWRAQEGHRRGDSINSCWRRPMDGSCSTR